MPGRFVILWLALAGFIHVHAHIGSPNVFYEGEAGPYQLRVSIRPPEVVPGRAQINVRIHNGPAAQVTALPVRWDAGRKGAPPPDIAPPVPGEANLFSTELWLMDFGAYSVFVDVEGPLGKGTAIVPLNSVANERLEMSSAAAAAFLAAGFILALLLILIVGAAVRESVLPPGVGSERLRRGRGRWGMGAAAVLLGLLLWKGNAWWKHVDAEFRNNRLFKPIEIATTVRTQENRTMLALASDASDGDWRDETPLVADHGKLMHLFLVRTDSKAFAHLHPLKAEAGVAFETALPPLPAGTYSVYGDVTHESGLARTLVSLIELREQPLPHGQTDDDDSWWTESTASSEISIRNLAPGPFFARQEITLRFDALATDGQPAPLDPYLGMWSHAVIRAKDGSVFTHLHPSGTISMTAQELFARRERGEDLRKPIDVLCGRPERELRFPYSFPKPGEYCMWVQVRSAGEVHTAAFEVRVETESD